jgi:hypothetical protein
MKGLSVGDWLMLKGRLSNVCRLHEADPIPLRWVTTSQGHPRFKNKELKGVQAVNPRNGTQTSAFVLCLDDRFGPPAVEHG